MQGSQAVAAALVDLLACPETGLRLELRDRSELAELAVAETVPAFEAGLVRADGAVAYPVRAGIPCLFREDGIPLSPKAERARNGFDSTDSGFDRARLARLAELERWHFWFVGRRALVRRLLDRYAGRAPQRVLDVGCGTGSILGLLARRGHEVVGLDTDLEGLAYARQMHSSVRFVRGDGARLPFRSESFDGVTVLDVLEHVEDGAVLAEIRRVLKPSGWVLVSVPALPRLWSHSDEVAGHRRRYTRRTLERALASVDLEAWRVTHYQALLLPLVAATRLLGRHAGGCRELEQRPSPLVNRVLGAVTAAELEIGRVVSWPFGSSLVAVCRLRGREGRRGPP